MPKIFNRFEIKSCRRTLRHHMPLPEVILWSRLKGRQLNDLKFRRQHSVGKYVLDFYCPALKLAVEIDGDSHYFLEENRRHDANRDNFLASLGIEVLRFTNNDVYTNLSGVLQTIATIPTPPRQGGENGQK